MTPILLSAPYPSIPCPVLMYIYNLQNYDDPSTGEKKGLEEGMKGRRNEATIVYLGAREKARARL